MVCCSPTTPDNPDTPSQPDNPTTPSVTPAGTAASDNQPAPEPKKALPQTGDGSMAPIAVMAGAGVAAAIGGASALRRH
uniref:LPXTG cell wall anchor domain-containing protein n=1 Tax=Parolsenella massiliensis TaxID=1871022 RepID=UPI0009FA1FEA